MDKVRVYWNLHKKCWSVQDRKTGRVIRHETTCVLSDAKFVVRKAGQAKVRREGKKNVHAFAVGTVTRFTPDTARSFMQNTCKAVTYNPYVNDTFVYKDTGQPVTDADTIVVGKYEGRPSVWAYQNRPTLDTSTPTN
jgi:hypothetical protein